jgi:hypothetical protein
MRGLLTVFGVFLLAIAQYYASDNPNSRRFAYGLFGLGAAMLIYVAVHGSL